MTYDYKRETATLEAASECIELLEQFADRAHKHSYSEAIIFHALARKCCIGFIARIAQSMDLIAQTKKL